MSDDCRKAFEKWAKSVGRGTYKNTDGTYLNRIEDEWTGWQAAWNHVKKQPEPSVPKEAHKWEGAS